MQVAAKQSLHPNESVLVQLPIEGAGPQREDTPGPEISDGRSTQFIRRRAQAHTRTRNEQATNGTNRRTDVFTWFRYASSMDVQRSTFLLQTISSCATHSDSTTNTRGAVKDHHDIVSHMNREVRSPARSNHS